HGRAENETAALDPDNELDVLIHERHCQRIDRQAEPLGILQQRRDVVEQNSRFRKIGNVTDSRFQLVHVCWLPDCEAGLARGGTSSCTSTSSTRAPGGPWRTARSKRSTASASPSASASTRPSGRFRTQP